MTANPNVAQFGELDQALAHDGVWSPNMQPSDRLVVFIHGFAAEPSDYRGLLERIPAMAKAHVYAPAYDAALYSDAKPAAVTDRLAARLNEVVEGYEHVDLAGHSMGTLFAREALLNGLGDAANSTPLRKLLETNALRMTLLAGTNRGFKPGKWTQSLGLETLRRWFWMTLLVVAAAWWLRILAIHPQNWFGGAVAALIGGAAVFPTMFFAVPHLRTWIPKDSRWSLLVQRPTWHPALVVGALLLIGLQLFDGFHPWAAGFIALVVAAMIAGLAFGLRRGGMFPWQGEVLLAADVLWTLWGGFGGDVLFYAAWAVAIAGTILTGMLLNLEQVSTGLMAAVVALVGWMAPWIAADFRPAWPMTLILLLPAFLYPMRSRLLIEHVLYGSAWVTGLRLRWIKTFARPSDGSSALEPPAVVHLFGEEDRLVGEDDHVELYYSTRTFEVALQGVKHPDFQLTAGPAFGADGGLRKARLDQIEPTINAALGQAFGENPDLWLQQLRAQPKAFGKTEAASPYRVIEAGGRTETESKTAFVDRQTRPSQPEHIVFLVHGIRDFADWQDSLAAKFFEVADVKKLKLAGVVQVRYGYFSALQFLLSGERERATKAFLDLYAQTKARHPLATCHAAAHSNGTFVVANALRAHGYVELENAYLCGSVLKPDFLWPEVGPNRGADDRGVVKRIRSDRASQDWPVGVLCAILYWIGRIPIVGRPYAQLGAGGVRGFNHHQDVGGADFVFENYYLDGDHGEALRPRFHAEIAEFVLTGEPRETDKKANGYVGTPDEKMLAGYLIRAVVGVGVLGVLIAASISFGFPQPWWGVAVGLLLTLIVLRVAMAV